LDRAQVHSHRGGRGSGDAPHPYDWLDAGERTQATVRQLSEQLRRFLSDQVWFENRRVIDILRSIESKALGLRDERNVNLTTEIGVASPALVLPMERSAGRCATD
jgi:hypothetical protein